MKAKEVYNEIRNISEELSDNKSYQRESLIELAMKILMQYKAEGGEQQEVYNALHSLYEEYAKNEDEEAKMDYIADILDYVCGWTSSKNYKLWDKYLF